MHGLMLRRGQGHVAAGDEFIIRSGTAAETSHLTLRDR